MKEPEFREFISTTKPVVLTTIQKYLHESLVEFVDDVAQETYFRAFKALQKKQFLENSKITTWIYTISKNESLRMNEKHKKEIAKNEKWKWEYSQNQKQSSAKDTENFSIENAAFNEERNYDLTKQIQSILEKLPKVYRDVLNLFLLGKSQKEIAEQLQVEPGTVKSRMSRGKKILRDQNPNFRREVNL